MNRHVRNRDLYWRLFFIEINLRLANFHSLMKGRYQGFTKFRVSCFAKNRTTHRKSIEKSTIKQNNKSITLIIISLFIYSTFYNYNK